MTSTRGTCSHYDVILTVTVIRYWAGHAHHYGCRYGHFTAFNI